MQIETLGEAFDAGWTITVRCIHGRTDGPSSRSSRECMYRRAIDLETLVLTRGRAFPLASLDARLRCPKCGNRRMAVLFEPPATPRAAAG
jgi:hypothetical protein